MEKNCKGEIELDMDTVLITLWNCHIENEGRYDSKIFFNNREFFKNSFENSYDAAWAVSLSGKWKWTDDYVYFNGEGYITSFSHWDDENSPIDIDKIDITHLINSLKKFHKKNKKGYVNNIPRAIHDALQQD